MKPASLSLLIALAVFLFAAPAQAAKASRQQAASGPLSGAAAADLATLYGNAMAAFNGNKWAEAADLLEKVIAMVTDPADQEKIGPIHYTLAVAHFNGGNYPKAVAAFKTFMAKYPADTRVAQARLALARATFLSKNYAEAIQLFTAYENVPALRDQALLVQAECYKALNKPDDQLRVLERLISPDITTTLQASGGLTVADMYLKKDQVDKGLAMLNKLHARILLVDNVVTLNGLTVKLGDELAEKHNFVSALAAYRVVRTREQVIEFQQARIADMDRRMQANLTAARGSQLATMMANATNREIEAAQADARKLLAAFEKLPDYMPGIVFRIAKLYYDWDKKWEAIAVFDSFLADYPQAKEREAALYSMLVCYADMMRIARTQALCERYLKEFPNGPNANPVGYLLGATSMESGDLKKAVTFFGMILERQPTSPFREQMRLGLGNAQSMQGEHAEALKHYRQYVKDFPKGQFLEEAMYREALTTLILGQYESALGKLRAHLQRYPQGPFAADAGYRVMVCKYAASLFTEIIADAKNWHAQNPNHLIAGEVYSLTGDALAAENRTAEAAASYMQAFKKATSDEVLNYALFEGAKQLQKLGKWSELAKMFEDFVREKPDHQSVVAAMFWISRAKSREGKTEEAKAVLIEQLKRHLNEPKREAVEQLLMQLAQLCSKRPRPPASATPSPPPPPPSTNTVAAPLPPPLPPYDSVGELKKQLAPLEEIAKPTGRARLLYAEAELAKLRKKPEEEQEVYAKLADNFKPTDLSPVLLAKVGDYLLAKGEAKRAAIYFNDMREDYPKSDYLDYAYVGLGEIALASGNHRKALELFTHAADELAASKIKEATMGRARALMELGRYAEAKKLFEQAASTREWRGETTAAAVFHLGEVEARQGKWPEAVAHFQRVFVAYQKFLPWAAKAYIRSAEAFDKLGKRKEAVGHLREMMLNPKLKEFPETKQAAKMLADWGQS